MKTLKRKLRDVLLKENINVNRFIDSELRLWLLYHSKNELLVKDGYLLFDDNFQSLALIKEDTTWDHYRFLLKYQSKKFSKKIVWIIILLKSLIVIACTD